MLKLPPLNGDRRVSPFCNKFLPGEDVLAVRGRVVPKYLRRRVTIKYIAARTARRPNNQVHSTTGVVVTGRARLLFIVGHGHYSEH